MFIRRPKPFFFNPPTPQEKAAIEERTNAHLAKGAEARAKMVEMGVHDVQPLIKVSRRRARAIAAANSVPQSIESV